MEKDILLNALNRLESKLDTVSTGLTANTVVTESHTKMLAEMKGVHDLNAKVILETRDQLKELNNTVVHITSWKGGQIKATEQHTEDIKTIHERLNVIEQDYRERIDKKKDIQSRKDGLVWKLIEKVAFAIIGAILISWRTIIDSLK